jgi:hypothetical protein
MQMIGIPTIQDPKTAESNPKEQVGTRSTYRNLCTVESLYRTEGVIESVISYLYFSHGP